jgi:hypothetical protein
VSQVRPRKYGRWKVAFEGRAGCGKFAGVLGLSLILFSKWRILPLRKAGLNMVFNRLPEVFFKLLKALALVEEVIVDEEDLAVQ